MKQILENLLENATTIFLPKNYKEKMEKIKTSTLENHIQSVEILKRSLEEITSKFRLVEAYIATETEFYGETKNKFTEAKESHKIKESFVNNEGVLYLVDSEIKQEINKNYIQLYSHHAHIRQAPDFFYELEGNTYWVNLEPIRDNEQEKSYSKTLELLYRTLFQTNKIDIDVNFEEYGKTTKERWYKLVYFRLLRNSLFLVVKDFEENVVFHHNFEHIREIKYSDTGDSYKFWLYMAQGTYRFYLPYTKESVNNPNLPIDPIIYNV
jgi:hypothetical protein